MRTREVEAAMKVVADEFAEAVPDAFAGDGVAFLQTVYKDPKLPLSTRLDAAAKAARFERPMLSTTNMRVINGFQDLTVEELERLVAEEDPSWSSGDHRVKNHSRQGCWWQGITGAPLAPLTVPPCPWPSGDADGRTSAPSLTPKEANRLIDAAGKRGGIPSAIASWCGWSTGTASARPRPATFAGTT